MPPHVTTRRFVGSDQPYLSAGLPGPQGPTPFHLSSPSVPSVGDPRFCMAPFVVASVPPPLVEFAAPEATSEPKCRRFSKPGPERARPIYTEDDTGVGRDNRVVAAVTTSLTAPAQSETLLRQLFPTPVVPTPPPKPVPSTLEQLLQRLLVGAQTPKPVPPVKTGITDVETLLQNLLPGIPAFASRTQPGPIRRGLDYGGVFLMW